MIKADIAIIGNGPAGISAALTAKARDSNFILFGNKEGSRKLSLAAEIDNCPGEYKISGIELAKKYQEQLDSMGIETVNERINNIYSLGKCFNLLTDKNEYEVKTVILATGAPNGKLIEGEKEYLGKGVSYCATCDGNLYRGKKIAIYCDDISLEEEIDYLTKLAKETYCFSTFKCELKDIIILPEKINKIGGDDYVKYITLNNGDVIDVDGVFVLRNVVNADNLVYGLKTENANVVVDRNMETNIPGLFACGDITGRPYQIAKALGEGNVALHSALSYVNKNK